MLIPLPEELKWEDISAAHFELILTETLQGIRRQMAELEAMEASYVELATRIYIGKKHNMKITYQYCEEIGGLRVGLEEKAGPGFTGGIS